MIDMRVEGKAGLQGICVAMCGLALWLHHASPHLWGYGGAEPVTTHHMHRPMDGQS